jgi:hypothetical protein
MNQFRRFTLGALTVLLGLAAGRAAGAQARTAPAVRLTPAQMLKVDPADCAGCHKDQKVLPAGHVAIKGKTYKDCQACHVSGDGQPGSLRTRIPGSHLHALNGIRCAECHDSLKQLRPVPTWKCTSCHGPTKDLAARTANVKPTNPHQSRHYGTDADCDKCHHQHVKSENDCGKCHPFNFQVS